jgi:hypothetical protein
VPKFRETERIGVASIYAIAQVSGMWVGRQRKTSGGSGSRRPPWLPVVATFSNDPSYDAATTWSAVTITKMETK